MSDRVMAGIVSCRARPPWGRICALAAQGQSKSELCLTFNVSRLDLDRELKARAAAAAVPAAASEQKDNPVPTAASATPDARSDEPLAPTTTSKRRKATNARSRICSTEHVRVLVCEDRVSWTEAAWLLCMTVPALRALAADQDWSAPVKVRRRASADEHKLIARVKNGELPARDAALELGIPSKLMERRVRRA